MKLRNALGIFAFALLIGVSSSTLLSKQRFQDTIRNRCYNMSEQERTLWTAGQRIPLANSMENFISLVEKLERFVSTPYHADRVIDILASWVMINGLTISEPDGKIKNYIISMPERARTELLNKFLFTRGGASEIPDLYGDSEICSLYYMLSHTVNETRSSLDGQEESCPTIERNRRSVFLDVKQAPTKIDDKYLSKCPLEQGVVSINSDALEAVALNRVIIGILAGLVEKDVKLEDYYSSDPSKLGEIIDELKSLSAKSIYAFTLGDLLGCAAVVDEVANSRIGSSGKWNSTQCTTEYRLLPNPKGVTIAEFKGAIDGLILGRSVKERKDVPRLSQILRNYYLEQHDTNDVHYCNRATLLQKYLPQEGMKDVENMAKMFYKVAKEVYDESSFEKIWKDVLQEYNNNKNLLESSPAASCQESSRRPSVQGTTSTCDTPSNVYFVIDAAGDTSEQRRLAADLANQLDLDEFRSSITVLSNIPTPFSTLGNLTYNATSKGCPACAISWYDESFGSNKLTDDQLLDALNVTIGDSDRARSHNPGIGSKVLLILKYSGQNGQTNLINQALNRIRSYHRDLRILGIAGASAGDDFIGKITREKTDIIKLLPDVQQQAKDVRERICKEPALLQYAECSTEASRGYEYRGYVTPNTIQYWAMYPQYFLKSFDIKFTFRAETGTINVCHSRSRTTLDSEIAAKKCEQHSAASSSKVIEFKMKNPCKGAQVHNCAPFYFSVEGVKSQLGTEGESARQEGRCFEPRCKTQDQIIFTVKHEGVQCNGAFNLLSSPLQLLGTLLTIFYILNKQQ